MADLNDVIDEFNNQSKSDKSVLARSWEAFRKWVKKLFGDILSNVVWELLKRWWETLVF